MADEASVRVLRNQQQLHPATAAFVDPDQEARYWDAVAASSGRRGERIAVVAIAFYQLLALGDLVSGVNRTTVWSLALRTMGAVPLLAFLLLQRRRPRLICRHGLVTGLLALLMSSWVLAALVVPDVGSAQHLSTGLLGLAMFVLVPNKVEHTTVVVGSGFVVWVVGHAVVHGIDPGAEPWQVAVTRVLAFTACLGIGWASATAIGAAQRDAFLLLNHERETNGQLTTEISRRKEVERALLERANTDPLTGVSSRRHFLERVEHELGRARRSRDPIALLLIDLDYFKSVNDRYGHAAGDEVLRCVSATFREHVRTVDLVGRLGGEEFGVVMPGADVELASEAAERVRRQVSLLRIDVSGGDVRPTVSIGVIGCEVWTETVEDALRRADAVMYEAKTNGRDRVVCR